MVDENDDAVLGLVGPKVLVAGVDTVLSLPVVTRKLGGGLRSYSEREKSSVADLVGGRAVSVRTLDRALNERDVCGLLVVGSR